MEKEKEIWQEVMYPSYHCRTEPLSCFVSNFGRVKTPRRIIKTKGNSVRIQEERITKLTLSKNGYMRCCAGLVHRLVGKAFVEKPEGWEDSTSWTINHKDLDKTNNHWTNLEWIPHSENCQHYYNSEKAIGVRRNPVEVWDYKTGEFVGVYPSQAIAARELGLHKTAISMIMKGRNKKTGGYGIKSITPEEYHAKKRS